MEDLYPTLPFRFAADLAFQFKQGAFWNDDVKRVGPACCTIHVCTRRRSMLKEVGKKLISAIPTWLMEKSIVADLTSHLVAKSFVRRFRFEGDI